jgi:hypothetical protein
MRGIAVDDEVKVENRGDLLVNQLEKAQKLPVPMAWHARQDDLAVFAAKCLSRETLNVYQMWLPKGVDTVSVPFVPLQKLNPIKLRS